ncbi:putative protein kinase RLK-Pelle-LRR-V family [Helianthus annuus]|nr:putative protein kinase RLK-Pelle-LRR-V family [Helianthus annuus]
MDELKVSLCRPSQICEGVSIWEWSGLAWDEGDEASKWFINYLGKPSRLMCFNEGRTLHDALHSDDGYKKKFSWNARIRMALGVARALEYLHDFSEPPIIHRNFKSANVLLDEDLSVHVSDLRFSSVNIPWLSKSDKSYEGPVSTRFECHAQEISFQIATA